MKKQLLTVNPVNPLVFLFSSFSVFLSYHQYLFLARILQFLERKLGGLLENPYFCGKLRNYSENCMAQF